MIALLRRLFVSIIQKMFVFFGILLVIYGLLKFTMGILALTLPIKYREKLQSIRFVRDFITMDVTMAGRFIDISIVLFATYSIIKGLLIAKLVKHKRLRSVIFDPTYTYLLYGVLGLVLLLFYIMIVYSNWNDLLGISKDNNETYTYKLSGIGSGLVFLITVLFIYIFNARKHMKTKDVMLLSFILTFLVMALGYILATTVLQYTSKKNEIVTLAMIPIGGGS